MSKFFDEQLVRFREKFDKAKGGITEKALLSGAKSAGFEGDAFKSEFLNNSDKFQSYAYRLANSLLPGKVFCTTYAAVVAAVAEYFKVDYTLMGGLCLSKDDPKYKENIEDFNKEKSSDDPHPFFANHAYVVINDKVYEHFGWGSDNIDRLDVVNI